MREEGAGVPPPAIEFTAPSLTSSITTLSFTGAAKFTAPIGTSPLYTVKQCIDSIGGITPETVYGVLSLITWALVVVTTAQGGGAFGYLMGGLFFALGAGRLYLLRRRR